MRQFTDKSYSICKQDLLSVLEFEHSRCRVQRGKKLVFCQDPRSCQCIQKSGLSCIRISDDRRCLEVSSGTLTADQFSVFLHLCKFCLECRDPGTDQSSVCFQFLLSRSSRTDTAAQTGQGFSKSDEARRTITKLRQFDLDLTLTGYSTSCKNIQDQKGSVHNLAVQFPFQIVQLCRRKFIITDDSIGIQSA